ncbi:DUF4185 domain-containing protein [Antrihabitans sp. YC2-6]|nr:DUF4185 domain-containing protein [Antrihabitans sp. YC2-6]
MALAAALVAAAALTVNSPTSTAAPCGSALGSTGSSDGSSFGGTNPIPFLNGQDGGLPRLKGRTQAISNITGLTGPNDSVRRFNVVGTDLGIMWDNGAGQILTAFGDTVGASAQPFCEGVLGDWRSNVLLRSTDRNLGDGMSLDGAALDRPRHAKEIIPSKKINGVEMTTIPTAGVAVNGVQYINFMSVRSWGAPGHWDTNYSALASSTDNGENWTVDLKTVRTNESLTGNGHFQMGAYVKEGGYVYLYGTPSGRFGAAYLARVKEADFTNQLAYEYWNGRTWTPTVPNAAVAIMRAPVSELSVAYNSYLKKFVALYTNEAQGLVMAKADRPEGPWSAPEMLISGRDVGGLYGAYIHPWSSGPNLYYVATTWTDYNVMLVRTTLS